MKVIFLDFDGVVVCLPTHYEDLELGAGPKRAHALNRACVARLNRIIRLTDAKVVVSSTWRRLQPIEYLRGYLRRAGFDGDVIDTTPILEARQTKDDALIVRAIPRGFEVALWLQWHPEVSSYVVLDDDDDYAPLPVPRWVLVNDGWRAGGLQDSHVEAAVLALGQEGR